MGLKLAMHGAAVLAVILVLAARPARADEGAADIWQAVRSYQYLRFCTQTWSEDPRALLAHFERERVDPRYDLSGRHVADDAWDGLLANARNLVDLRDFRMLDMLAVYLAHRDHPALAPGLMTKVEQALIDFKYWLTDPTPAGLIDQSVYWTENHQVTYYTLEYLAGTMFPDAVFGSDGQLGAVHKARAELALHRWLERKGRLGFTEWHSDVYYAASLRPLLLLADFADDPDMATRAAMVVDLLVLDLALNTYESTFGVSHGRSYKKDKTSGPREDTWNIAQLLFASSAEGFSADNNSAIYFARSANYVLPRATLAIARHRGSFVSRERMGIPMAETSPWEPAPQAPYGFSYTNPADLDVWWEMGAFVSWPTLPLTFTTLEQHGLWQSDQFAPLADFRFFLADLVAGQMFALQTAPMVNGNVLSEVNTYAWRSSAGMLASAVDHRPGFAGVQVHAWQATLDPHAVVFTNHPVAPLVPSDDWDEDYGYFTGEASWPRAGQHENVGIYLYAPQWYEQNPPPLSAFTYQPFTHAYFPQDHFDEVAQEAGWTLGRRGDRYVALYSWRPASFLAYEPTVFATNGMTAPFDLIADGGANNVWIVELGSRRASGSFDAFRKAIVASDPVVVDLGLDPALQLPRGFDVTYESPSQGTLTFGWQAPLTVKGSVVSTSDFPRFDNPFVATPFGDERYVIRHGRCSLSLDFIEGSRTPSCR